MQTTDDCPFKSPKELGLTRAERDALIKTLLLMENGQMIHAGNPHQEPVRGKYPFNMVVWQEQYHCGTICCIGGTAELVGDLEHGQLQKAANEISNR